MQHARFMKPQMKWRKLSIFYEVDVYNALGGVKKWQMMVLITQRDLNLGMNHPEELMAYKI